MKIAILGASGWIGSTIASEALARGHQVISVGRNVQGNQNTANNEYRNFDFRSNDELATAVNSADIVVASIGGRVEGNHDIVSLAATRLLTELPTLDIERLIWVGGAGSLEVAPGKTLVSVPDFPAEYKDEALAQGAALNVFRSSSSELNWLFVSPAADIHPGTRTTQYRVGDDQLLVDDNGDSKISVEDYALAIVDQIEKPSKTTGRIGLAY
jgi:putative NADH-flavin reductase